MAMNITNSSSVDIDEIFRLYELATAYQKTRYTSHWPNFERAMVEKEVEEKRQWKLLVQQQIACVWATTFNDAQIWGERDIDPSLYIHRIATNPAFRGQNLVTLIVEWAKQFAKENNKQFIRLDTVGDNQGLIKYYQKCGFTFLGLTSLADTSELPAHYHNALVCLFEIEIK